MKNTVILLFAILFSASRAMAQHYGTLSKDSAGYLAFSSSNEYKFHYDTTYVLMLVSDTVKDGLGIRVTDGEGEIKWLVWQKLGYVVQKVYGYPFVSEFICYLDANKRRFNYFVWMSQQIKHEK